MPTKPRKFGKGDGWVEVYRQGRRFTWRRFGKNGRPVSDSAKAFTARRYASASARAEHPRLELIHIDTSK